jgi:hypothetical protein
MIIIFAHKLVDDTKQELLSEIEKFRTDNHIKEKVIVIPKTQESLPKPILSEPELPIAQNLPDDTNQEILSEIEKIRIEEIILERIPEISCPPAELIVPKSGLSSSEQNARKYHTKNMISRYNTVKQRYNKQKYHKTQNRIR